MALKLKVVEPQPNGPRPPAVPVEALPTDDAALIKIWRPQAAMRARKGDTEFAIARFLHSKGIDKAAARDAAAEILANPGSSAAFGGGLAKAVGILLLMAGLLAPVGFFVLNIGGFIGAAALFGCFMGVIAGCKLLWGAPRD